VTIKDPANPEEAKPSKSDKVSFVLGVDLDGVVGDFYAAIRPIVADWKGCPVDDLPAEVSFSFAEWGLTSETYLPIHRFAVVERQLFRNMPIIHGAAAALRRLSSRGVRIRIVTHRLFVEHFHSEAVKQTVRWLDAHGIPYWDLCFLRDKDHLGCDLFIDDAPHNVERLRAAGQETIVFANSTNRDVPGPRAEGWGEVEALVEEALRKKIDAQKAP